MVVNTTDSARLFWAEFLTSQFGVETLANDSLFYRVQASFSDETKEKASDNKTGIYAFIHSMIAKRSPDWQTAFRGLPCPMNSIRFASTKAD